MGDGDRKGTLEERFMNSEQETLQSVGCLVVAHFLVMITDPY